MGSRVRAVYDSWRILDGALIASRGVRYASLGYEPAATWPTKATVTP
jgi:UDP-N-acetyl-D-mannosaminuronic acid dehydrogenase